MPQRQFQPLAGGIKGAPTQATLITPGSIGGRGMKRGAGRGLNRVLPAWMQGHK